MADWTFEQMGLISNIVSWHPGFVLNTIWARARLSTNMRLFLWYEYFGSVSDFRAAVKATRFAAPPTPTLRLLPSIRLPSAAVGPLARRPVDYDRAAWSWQHTAVTWMAPFTLVWGTRGNRSGSFSISASHDVPRGWQKGGREGESCWEHVFKWLRLNSVTVTCAPRWAGPSLHFHTLRTQCRIAYSSLCVAAHRISLNTRPLK